MAEGKWVSCLRVSTGRQGNAPSCSSLKYRNCTRRFAFRNVLEMHDVKYVYVRRHCAAKGCELAKQADQRARMRSQR